MSYSVIFLSSAEIANPLLSALHKNPHFQVLGLICAPDKAAGRKLAHVAPAPKHLAEDLKIPVHQPAKLSQAEDLRLQLQGLKPDFLLTFAYGQILNTAWLGLARFPALNVHPSLLPKYRGPSPLQGALLAGDVETGITLMQMVEKMDAGPVYSQLKFPLMRPMTLNLLHDLVAQKAAEWIPEQMLALAEGGLQAVPQVESEATYTQKVEKEDGFLDFKESAEQVLRKFDAYTPWPGLWTNYKGKRLKFLDLTVANEVLAPGEVRMLDGRLFIGTEDGSLHIKQLQLEGKQSLHAEQFVIGQPEFSSAILPS